MTTSSPWLSDDEQTVWRLWLEASGRLPLALDRQLGVDSTLSHSDFGVLVSLSEAPGHRLRAMPLAQALRWERSRLSHHIARMERRGLVERRECASDGRGAWVVATQAGIAALRDAAPGHADTVRRLVFDDLTAQELTAFGDVLTKVLTRLDARDEERAAERAEAQRA